ncbi:sensor histidine kinase [Micrococcus sp.]|uniref:sensor histidine kinase n=1 Tax=Micrococcus sp. TaxID=1271 RepID=UPI0026DDC462|nr:histidine kinase [Micrococcus sp.]MDO4240160.1 histidine kinase [Micrococcus sp.]
MTGTAQRPSTAPPVRTTPEEVAAVPAARRTLPREEWSLAVAFAGVWLVFLLTTVVFIGIELAAAQDWGRLAGLVATTAAFVVVYLAAYLVPHPVPGRPQTVSTLLYTAVLATLALTMGAVGGPFAVNTVPYIAAVWVFTHPRRVAVRAGLLLGAVGLAAAALLLPPAARLPGMIGLAVAVVVILVVRLATDREDSLTAVRHELALSQQREQLARDVHDVVGHSLTAVHVKAQLVRRLIDVDPARAAAETDEIIALTRTALGEVRSTVDGMAAPELVTELARARRMLADAGIRLDAPSPDAVAGLPRATADLYAWVLREAVTNVLRHAAARTVRVTVSTDRLAVLDDGVGPGAGRIPEPDGRVGQGIPSMRTRVERAGGALALAPAHPGCERPGTLVEVTL